MDSEQAKLLIATKNAALRDEFLAVVKSSRWPCLTKTSNVDSSKFAHLIIVGVAFWSRPDVSALKRLAEKLTNKNVTVLVFDIDEFGYTDGIKAFLPGAPMPNQTPVIAEYLDGVLTRLAEGVAAVDQHFLQTS